MSAQKDPNQRGGNREPEDKPPTDLNKLSPEDRPELAGVLLEFGVSKSAAPGLASKIIEASGSFEDWRDLALVPGVTRRVRRGLQSKGLVLSKPDLLGQRLARTEERAEMLLELSGPDILPVASAHPSPGMLAVHSESAGNLDDVQNEVWAIVERAETAPLAEARPELSAGMLACLRGSEAEIRAEMEKTDAWEQYRNHSSEGKAAGTLLPRLKAFGQQRKGPAKKKVPIDTALRQGFDLEFLISIDAALDEALRDEAVQVFPAGGAELQYIADRNRSVLVFSQRQRILLPEPFADFLSERQPRYAAKILAAYAGGILHGQELLDYGFIEQPFMKEGNLILRHLAGKGLAREDQVVSLSSDTYFSESHLLLTELCTNANTRMSAARYATEAAAQRIMDLLGVPEGVLRNVRNEFSKQTRVKIPKPQVEYPPAAPLEERPAAVEVVEPTARPAEPVIDPEPVYKVVSEVLELQDQPDITSKTNRSAVAGMVFDELERMGAQYRPGMVTGRLKQLAAERKPSYEELEEPGQPIDIIIEGKGIINPYVLLEAPQDISERALRDRMRRIGGRINGFQDLTRHVSSRHTEGKADNSQQAMFDRLQERRIRRYGPDIERLERQRQACEALLDPEYRGKVDEAIRKSSL